MSSDDVPEPWASAMIAAGLKDPRYARDIPSRRALADAAGTTTSTISAMIAGTRDTDGRVIQAVAVALGMEDQADEVTRWVGHARTSPKPFRPHRDADLLTAEEQAAVNELIRLLALAKKRAKRDGGTGGVVVDLPKRDEADRKAVAEHDPIDPGDEAEETERST